MEELRNRGGLVEVLNSQDANYVHLAHSLLSDKGFFVRVENENTNLIPGLSVGVSLMVREEDAAAAIKALEEAEIIPPQEAEVEELASLTAKEQGQRWHKLWIILLILVVVLAVLALYTYYLNQQPV